VRFLKDCGLLGDETVELDGGPVVPKDLLIGLLTPRLSLGPEGDILAMRVVVRGTREGRPETRTFQLVDFMDREANETAMARTTCFPAVVAAHMLAEGLIEDRGVRFPEEVFAGELGETLLSELALRGVRVTEAVDEG
jgi:lysine 6-dehydrogenase